MSGVRINISLQLKILRWCLFFLWVAPDLSIGQKYVFTSKNIDVGLAHNNVFDIYQDKDGFLWLGTGSHLQRFDGQNFITFEHRVRDSESLSYGDIRSIAQDDEGALWIGTDGGGISVLKNGTFRTYKKSEEANTISSNVIEQVLIMPDGTIYAASWDNGINILKEGIFSQMLHDPDDPNTISDNTVPVLFYDEETKRLWIGTWGGGLCYMEDGKVHRVPIKEGSFNSPNARIIEKASDGAIWIGSWGNGVFRFKDNTYEHYSVANGSLENDNVLTLQNDGSKFWIGTWGGGITLFENNQFKTFRHDPDVKNTISSDFVESSLLDADGKLIIGTFGGGITIFEQTSFEHLTFTENNQDKSSNFINSITEDTHGRTWIATNQGVFIKEGAQITALEDIYPEFEKIKPAYELQCAKNGDIWIGGGTGIGLFRFDGKRLIDKSVWENIDFRDYFIFDIMEARDGSFWISANIETGMVQLTNEKVIRYLHDPEDSLSIPTNNFSSSLEAKDGTLWFCSNRGGVITYRNGKFTQYNYESKNSNSLSNSYAYYILESSKGQIWVATEHGLNLYDPAIDGFRSFFKEDGLLDNTILSLAEDQNGKIWIATHRGVSQLDPEQMIFQNFDSRSGVQGYPFNRLAIFKSPTTNKIHVGGVNGLTIFHPDSVSLSYRAFSKITNVLVNGQSIYFDGTKLLTSPASEESDELTLLPFRGSLTFHFSDMSYGKGEELKYSYRINNLEDRWNKVENTVAATYSSIPPGTHTFEVRSSRDGYNWSVPDQITFTIQPFWWQTLWFKLAIIVLIILIASAFVLWRIRYLELQKRKLEHLVYEKTSEIRVKNKKISEKSEELIKSNADLKDALVEIKKHEHRIISFQENEREAIKREVHDSISSSLFAIRMMMDKGLKKINQENSNMKESNAVNTLLQQVINDSRIILKNLSSNSEDQHASFFETLNDLVERSRELSDADISINWSGAHAIDELKVASNIFRIMQEVLANSLQHSKARNVNITFENGDEITWSIEDDGVGFDTSEIASERGLQRIKDRALEIEGQLYIESKINKGTKVLFTTNIHTSEPS